MSIVVSLEDPSYCESKAIELITEAKALVKENPDDPQYQEKIAQAISLLALSRVQRNGTTEASLAKKA